jgi:hypothetical protein
MTETTSLDLSKQLAVYLPDAKTEYVWVLVRDSVSDWERIEERVKWEQTPIEELVCPAWQIHELLTELPACIITRNEKEECGSQLSITKYADSYICEYWLVDGLAREQDVRLVEALGKLLLWKVKA